MTTASPSSITRSPAPWCGLAPFGPDPTIVKSALEWPWWSSSRARSPATSTSRRPANRTVSDVGERRVRRGAGGSETRQLVGVLDRPQQRQRRGHRRERAVRQRLLQREHVQRPAGIRDRPAAGTDDVRGERVRVLAVGPLEELHIGALGVGALEARQDEDGIAARGDDEQREALGHLVRRVAGQVQQVGAGGDE